MERGLLLDIVVRQRPAVLQLLAREDQPLLVRRDALLVLDLGLDIVNGVRWLDLEGDGLAGERLDKDLHGFFFCELLPGQGAHREVRRAVWDAKTSLDGTESVAPECRGAQGGRAAAQSVDVAKRTRHRP